MASDGNDLTGGQPLDDSHDEIERQSRDGAHGADGHLTHAQRVERVNAYLKAVASKGIWSAIE
jgi:hypothetical protein